MDQKTDALGLMRMSGMMSNAMSVSGSGRNTAAADGEFQKMLEKAQAADRPAQSRDKRPDAAQKQDQASPEEAQEPQQTEKPQAEGGQQQDQSTQEVEAVKVWEDPKEMARRLMESGIVTVEQTYMAAAPVQEVVEEVPETTVVVAEGGVESALPVGQTKVDRPILASYQPTEAVVQEEPVEARPLTQGEAMAMEDLKRPFIKRDFRANATPEERALIRQIQEAAGMKEEGEATVTRSVTAVAEPLFGNLEAPPVKVGESYDAEQVLAQDVNTQLADQLIPAINQGETKVEIQLTPENLGTVKIEIVQSESGAVHVAISAENSQTRTLLEKHADSLQAMLADRGQGPVQVEVRHQEEAQQNQDNPYDGHNGQGGGQQEQNSSGSNHSDNGQDFLNQLRLGLIDQEDDEE